MDQLRRAVSPEREEYVARINRVIDHIEAHIGEPLGLDELAEVASFSKYHFHRVFFALVGETLGQYIQRLRLEKAAIILLTEPRRPVTSVALDVGFAGSASFAKAFRDHHGCSASEWRRRSEGTSGHQSYGGGSKIGQANRKLGVHLGNPTKESTETSVYVEYGRNTHVWRFVMKDKTERRVEVKSHPATTVAYVRHVGPYQGNSALFETLWNRLMSWAGPRGLIRPGETEYRIYYHDNPDLTDKEKLRVSVSITVPPGTPVEGEVGTMSLEAGTYAHARFPKIGPKDFPGAWQWVYGEWLPRSGYVPGDGAPFELYHQDNAGDQAADVWDVDICLPVKPMKAY